MIQGTSKPSLILKRLPVIRMATGNFPALPEATGSVAAGQSGPGQARRAGTSPPPKSPSSRAQGGTGQQRRRGAEAWGYLRLEGSCGCLGGRSAAGGSLRNDVPRRVRNAASRAAEEDKEPAPTPVLRPNLPARGCVTRIAPSSWMPLVVLRRRATPTATPPPRLLGTRGASPATWSRALLQPSSSAAERGLTQLPESEKAACVVEWDEGCLALTGLLKLTDR